MRDIRRLAILAVLPLTSETWAQAPPADVRGIYVYSSDVSQISKGSASTLTASLNVSGTDGVVLVIGWASVEPAMGQYQWTTLDQWISQAISLGKKIDLTVTAGVNTPSWLFQAAPGGAGAQSLNFTISPHSGATSVCDAETIAPSWDSALLSQWDSMLAALSAHLKSAGTYSAITLLRLTGINRTTDEFRLPAETPQSTGLACVSDAVAIWQQAGYRPSLLLHAWDRITGSFQKSFPDKAFSVAIISQNAFPRIAEDGSVVTGAVPDQNQAPLQLASQKFPGRLVVQFNFLMPGEAASPEVVQAAPTLGTMAAFQTNNYFGSSGQGAACSGPVTNPTPCTAGTYLALLQTGIYPLGRSNSLRAQYIEVFPANANAFPDDIQQAHTTLTGPPTVSNVVNAAGRQAGIVPGSFASIFGSNFSSFVFDRWDTYIDPHTGVLPAQIDGLSVPMGGKPAFINFIIPTQINVQAPDGSVSTVAVVVTSPYNTSAVFHATALSAQSAFFPWPADQPVATHLDYNRAAKNGTIPGIPAVPARHGEIIILWGTGFGPTNPPVPAGLVPGEAPGSPAAPPIARPVTVTVNGINAPVISAILSAYAANCQIAITVPPASVLGNGDFAVKATISGVSSPDGILLTVQS